MESLQKLVEAAAGDVDPADAAERRAIEELRHMGHEALDSMGGTGYGTEHGGRRDGTGTCVQKKTSTGPRPSEESR